MLPGIVFMITETAKARLRDEPGYAEGVAERMKIVVPPARCKQCGRRMKDDGQDGYCSLECFTAPK